MQGLRERGVTLWSSVSRAFKIGIAVVGGLGIYDAFGSQLVPEHYREHLPKLYELVQMTASVLSVGQWLLVISLLFLAALFEHIHRERMGKVSITPVFLLLIGGVLVLLAAYQQNRGGENNNITLNEFRGKIEQLERDVSYLKSSQIADKSALDSTISSFKEYMDHLSDKAKSRRLEKLIAAMPQGIEQTVSAACSDLNAERSIVSNQMFMRFRYRYPTTMVSPTIDSVLSETGESNPLPSDLEDLRQKYLKSLADPNPNETAVSKSNFALFQYEDACDKLKNGLARIGEKIKKEKEIIDAKISNYENSHKI